MHKPYSLEVRDILAAQRRGDRGKARLLFENLVYSNAIIDRYTPLIYNKGQKKYFQEHDGFISKKFLENLSKTANKLLRGASVRVLFLNDMGFNAGAGIALKRQCEAFIEKGHQVHLFTTHSKPIGKSNCFIRDSNFQYKSFSHFLNGRLLTDKGRFEIEKEIVELFPDMIITGNFHAHFLSQNLLLRLRETGIPTFVYAHDCDWVTGGCAHYIYYDCDHYKTGCDSYLCPKNVNDYPPTPSFKIGENWLERTKVFSGSNSLPIVTNSEWMKSVFSERFPRTRVVKVPLSINTNVFYARNKQLCREKLSLPSDKTIILAGAATVSTKGKGLDTILKTFEHYNTNRTVEFLIIGNNKGIDFPNNVTALGHIQSEDNLAEVYSACDIYISPSKVESFGQTLLEAIACGSPVVTYNTTGIGEISVDRLTGIHAKDELDFINKIDLLISDSDLRNT